MVKKIIAMYKDFGNSIKNGATSKTTKIIKFGIAATIIIILGYIIKTILTGAFKYVSANIEITLLILFIIACILNYFFSEKKKEKTIIPDVSMLEYNYKMFRKHLYKIISGIAGAVNLAPPKLPSDLDAPVRWTFNGSTPIYHYLSIINGGVDIALLKSTLQLRINQGLENGSIDGKEASSILLNGLAYPRIMVHEVGVTGNFAEISIAFVTEEYAEAVQSNFASDVDNALDIRDIEDEDI